MPDSEAVTIHVIESITSLLGDDETQEILKDEEHCVEALHKLNLPSEAWKPLLHLLSRAEHLQSQAASGDQLASSRQPSAEEEEDTGKKPQEDPYTKTQLEAFDHIRAAFWVAMSMSIGLFMVGLVLTGFALFEAARGTSLSTLTIGGLGQADFVLLFFRRPWQDISVNLADSQQVRTITTTYLAGLALV
jgi:hypothetical protein